MAGVGLGDVPVDPVYGTYPSLDQVMAAGRCLGAFKTPSGEGRLYINPNAIPGPNFELDLTEVP